jgi:hypothetical protein
MLPQSSFYDNPWAGCLFTDPLQKTTGRIRVGRKPEPTRGLTSLSLPQLLLRLLHNHGLKYPLLSIKNNHRRLGFLENLSNSEYTQAVTGIDSIVLN